MHHNHEKVDNPISDGWIDRHAASLSTRIARATQWTNQPPALRQETLERVRRVVQDHPHGYLAKYWRQIYG